MQTITDTIAGIANKERKTIRTGIDKGLKALTSEPEQARRAVVGSLGATVYLARKLELFTLDELGAALPEVAAWMEVE